MRLPVAPINEKTARMVPREMGKEPAEHHVQCVHGLPGQVGRLSFGRFPSGSEYAPINFYKAALILQFFHQVRERLNPYCVQPDESAFILGWPLSYNHFGTSVAIFHPLRAVGEAHV
jgi:hypothetical protein